MSLTLEQILAAKEERYHRQLRLRQQYGTAIASITINMPGPVKDGPLIRQLCAYAAQALQQYFDVLAMEQVNLLTGPEAVLAVQTEPESLKAAAVRLEDEHPFGRLLDIDVFSADGTQLSRQTAGHYRTCLLCSQPAVSCMRERRHSLTDIQQEAHRRLQQFAAFQTRTISPMAEKLGSLAVEAMLYEVTCTPSPGLVDRVNSGAHKDMDFFSFMASSAALSLAMARCAEAGLRHNGSLPELLPILRLIGLDGEEAMLTATKGVNTQKGLLFSLGIIVAAAGWLTARKQPRTAAGVLAVTAQIVAGIVERELGYLRQRSLERKLTAGEKLYLEYGIRGIRGEMEEGLPAVQHKALPALQEALRQGLSINDALVHTLFVLMTTVEDTTVMNRHNRDKLENWVRPQASEFLRQGSFHAAGAHARAAELDRLFIEHNVSPGGAADLLAVTWFLHRLESLANRQPV